MTSPGPLGCEHFLTRADIPVACRGGARVYDHWLGGKDNSAADRAGIRRFPDVGTGTP
jgi:hypothetical protein